MSEQSDKISGRAKQVAGVVTGDKDKQHEGERQEDKGKLKGKLNSAIDHAEHALKDLKHKANKA